MPRSRLPGGLRIRLLLALLLTSLATLGVAATVLVLRPLPDRLRAQSAVNLRAAVLASRPAVEDAVRSRLENEFALRTVAEELRQRTDGRVVVEHPVLPGAILYDTSTDASARGVTVVALRTLRTGATTTQIVGDVVRIGVRLFGANGSVIGVLVVERRLTEVTTAVGQVRNALLAAGAVGLLVAIALAVALSSTLLRRLGRLRNAAVQITKEGVDAPVQHDEGRDEVGDLARAFTRMQEELRRQEAARRSFVATASHELRTPLTMLQGTMELLEEDIEDGRVDIADLRIQVARARRELLRLSSLAGELLDLSRLDASVPLRSEPVELGELARAVAAEFALKAEDRGARLDVVPPGGPCWSRGDPDAIARVVRILVDNALRYGPAGEPVRIAAGRSLSRVYVEVADRGPGVHPAEREQIFERFQRGRTAGGEGGFGLGLAIGRELAERMDGSLVLAGDEGQGTRFRLELPGTEPDREPAPRPDARPTALR